METKISGGQDFIVRIIQYLEYKHGIALFVTPKDFDALYNWWEKRIPLKIIKAAITNVVERWQEKEKNIYSFSNFRYEVRKNFKAFLQLNVGSETGNPETGKEEEKGELAEIENFLNNYPQELNELREDFNTLYRQLKNKESAALEPIHRKLSDLFKGDKELNLKARVFLRNLSPELRKPEIEHRYRLNYLLNKFNIPDFDIL
jgi:hypothetical protein